MGNSQEPLAAGLLSGLMALATDGKGEMHSWSSLIGISTALAGNVLISLALNVQRYAHIRIDREFVQDKAQRQSDWKRMRSGRDASGTYGAVEQNGQRRGRHPQNSTLEPYRDESPEPRRSAENHAHGQRTVSHGLHDSISSDRTARPEDTQPAPGHRKSYLRSPYWWIGIVLMVLGEAGNFLAYGFAPASIVSPLGVVALISNCVIAPFMLREQFRKRDLWGVFVAITGAVVVVLSAKSSEEKIGPHEIWLMITRWEFELYLGLTAGLIVVLMSLSGKYGTKTILIDVGLVGLLGGYTALSTKGVSSLLSFKLWHVITFPITYLLVFVLVFSALMQIRYINRALQRFDSTQVIPTQFVLFTLSVITGSAVLYRDFESFTPDRTVKFVGGCLLTFLGVYFITSGRVRADSESVYSANDEEEAIGLLSGEQYHDDVDEATPEQDTRVRRPSIQTSSRPDEVSQSPNESLLSQGIDELDEDEEQATPRGALSIPPSTEGSLAAESLRAPSPETPHSLVTNPWAEFQAQRPPMTSSTSEPQIRPVTPPGPSSDQNTESTVLLRFPPAPGTESHSPQVDANLQTQQTSAGADGSAAATAPQTPPSRRLRNSISVRFSPGALLPTLSGGFSAVIAESIRRGETSPVKDRKTRRRSDRTKQIRTDVVDGAFRSRTGETQEAEYDSDGAVVDDTQPATGPFRFNSTGEIPSTDAMPTTGRTNENPAGTNDDNSGLNRLRSLSDSWNGPAWLGSVLRRSNSSKNQAATANEPAQGQSAHPAVSEEDKQQNSSDQNR